MSKTPDKNYVSVAGTEHGIQIVDYRQPEGFTHRFLTGNELLVKTVELGDIFTPLGWADALKVSGVKDFIVMAAIVEGGYEDVVDINHCDNVVVQVAEARPRGLYVATIKGGSTGISLSVWNQNGHGSETDYDIGNWSDQSQEPTKNVSLLAHVAGGGSARVRAINADKPHMNQLCAWEYNGWLRGWFPWVQRIGKLLGIA